TSDFDFDLPEELIAQRPPAERGQSRLLVLPRQAGAIEHTSFVRLGDHLRAGDLLVLNDTRVFPARLVGHRVPSGGAVECLLLRKLSTANSQLPVAEEWEALMHPGQKLKPGARVVFEAHGVRLHGEVLARHFHGRRTIRLWNEEQVPISEAIDLIGHIPLPPYISRHDDASDRERYQTVYAGQAGSVAAPTAGLHFTTSLLDELKSRGVEQASITLHVGYGTFKPVRVERVEAHEVDPETYTVSASTADALTSAIRDGRRIIAVGTTTTRALESLTLDAAGRVHPSAGNTTLFIHPGHHFRIVQGLVTNFHLPRSSLLMLVAAFTGRERILAAYREAVVRGYRFYSYGDAMLIA
ncbi:MAG TPA: tRNA preQ1(34) S-adenosylmethionine ribosyltransferase-isomerase QueA, partial [Vicinamibacterales bacterium]|nr:tRNA preQ1(34) S-adenosylmethionine ribosyltransferase-isomerase QueA [Vicinamibacterales bacterium]